MPDVKFCKDCKFWASAHHTDVLDQLKFARCYQDDVVWWNSTDGGKDVTEYLSTGIKQPPYCSAARLGISPCGPDAKLYQPKETTEDALQDRPIVIRTCPVCRSPHPADVSCKELEARDNGYTLERRT